MNTTALSTSDIRPSFFHSIGVVLLAAIVLIGTTGAATSTPAIAAPDTLETRELSDEFVQAAETAELSDEEMALLRDVIAEASETRGDPAAMWRATTTAHENLRADQRAALAEALQEVQGERGQAQGERRRTQRQEQHQQMRQQQDSADRPQRRQTRRGDRQPANIEAMAEALELTAEQREMMYLHHALRAEVQRMGRSR